MDLECSNPHSGECTGNFLLDVINDGGVVRGRKGPGKEASVDGDVAVGEKELAAPTSAWVLRKVASLLEPLVLYIKTVAPFGITDRDARQPEVCHRQHAWLSHIEPLVFSRCTDLEEEHEGDGA